MKKVLKIVVVLLIIGLAGWGYFKFKAKKDSPTWRLFPVQRMTITQTITSIGTINPISQVNIGTEVSGKIEKLYKDFNDTVKKGELLAKLDTETLEMALEESKIELNKTRLTVDKNLIDLVNDQELFEKEMISEYQYKQTQYTYNLSLEQLTKSQFTVQRAEKNLNNAYIYSPIDGVVTSRNVDEGQTVAASLNAPTLFIIANRLDEMQIEALIDEADIGKVKEGLSVNFTVDAFTNKKFVGEIKQIRLNPKNEQNVITYPVIISIKNKENILMPGMTANLDIIISENPEVLAIQERALQFRPTEEIWKSMGIKSLPDTAKQERPQGQMGRKKQLEGDSTSTAKKAQIWVLENNMPIRKIVEVGNSDGTFIEVLSGLEEGIQVILGLSYVSNTNGSSSAFSGNIPTRRF